MRWEEEDRRRENRIEDCVAHSGRQTGRRLFLFFSPLLLLLLLLLLACSSSSSITSASSLAAPQAAQHKAPHLQWCAYAITLALVLVGTPASPLLLSRWLPLCFFFFLFFHFTALCVCICEAFVFLVQNCCLNKQVFFTPHTPHITRLSSSSLRPPSHSLSRWLPPLFCSATLCMPATPTSMLTPTPMPMSGVDASACSGCCAVVDFQLERHRQSGSGGNQ